MIPSPVRSVAGRLPALVLLAVLPAALQAQRPVDVGVWGGRSVGALDGADLLGLSAAWLPGPVGTRFSAAAGWHGGYYDPYGGTTVHRGDPTAWAVDGDVVVSPFRAGPLRPLARVFEPYLFVGAGPAGLELEPGVWDNFWTVGYGGGVAVPIGSRMAFSAEARRRRLLEHGGAGYTVFPEDDWEVRAAVSLRFGGEARGGRHHAEPPRRRRRPRRRHVAAGTRTFPVPGDTLHLGGSGGGRVALGPTPRPVGDVGDSAPGDGGARVFRNVRPAVTDAPALAEAILSSGEDFLGVGYRFGGTDPSTGLDCSAFVQRAFREHGVRLPRTSRQQARTGTPVPTDLDALVPGDLVFFSSSGSRIDHVAIYAGDGLLLHSTSSGGGVRYDDLRSPRGRWFLDHMVGARRVLDGGGWQVAAGA